jgi:hypothetical protein
MRVDIHDHEVAVFPLARLSRGVREKLSGVEFLHGEAMDLVRGRQFHGIPPVLAPATRAPVFCSPFRPRPLVTARATMAFTGAKTRPLRDRKVAIS